MANYPKPKKGTRHNASTGYESGIRRELAEQRSKEAAERQSKHDALTLEQKVASLQGLTASKERAKLARAIAARNNKPAAKAKKAV